MMLEIKYCFIDNCYYYKLHDSQEDAQGKCKTLIEVFEKIVQLELVVGATRLNIKLEYGPEI